MKKILQGTKALAIVVLLMMTATMVNAQKTAVASGNWNTPATWSPVGVPSATDDVIINNGVNVTVNTAATCASLTINAGGTATTVSISGTNSLAVTGAITINSGTGSGDDRTLAVGAGTLTCASITMEVTGNDNRTNFLTISTGTATVSGNITMNDADVDRNSVAISGAGTLNVSGSFTGGAVSFVTTSTVNYNGAAQTIRGASYGNLILSGSGVKTTTGVTVNTKLTMGGTATAGNTITYSTAILEYNGTAPQTTSLNEFSSNNANIDQVIINNASGVTLNDATTLNDADLLLSAGTFATGTNLTISTSGLPVITVDGGSITGTLQGTGDYDVDYTAGTQSAGAELTGAGLSDIDVDLNAATDVITLTQNVAPDGDVTLSQGILDLGSFTINRSAGGGGTFNITNDATLRIGGTNSFPSNYSSHAMSATNATVEYAGTAQSVIDLASGENYTILILSGSGVKTLAAGVTVEVLLSIQGTATLAGSVVTYSTANLEYKGSAAQTTSNVEFPAALTANVIIDNAAGVSLNGAKTLNGSLTLTNGVLTTTAANLLTMPDGFATVNGGSTASYIDGPVRKNGNDAYTFKVGRGGVYSPVTISAPDNTGDAFTCEYKRESATALGPITVAGIFRVSNCEYWELTEAADAGGATSISVTVGWYSNSGCGNWDYISDYTGLRLVHFNGTSWNALAGTTGSPVGDNTTGTITRTAVNTFSPFALGSAIDDGNALPVNFSNVKAFEKGTGVQIEWTNLTEKDLVNYIVERSANGRDFTAIAQVAPRSNQADKESYTSFDPSPMAGAN
ncbi:MAG TPA: hypothetical protein PKI55_08755, partial [Chitinophagaceae bacterium]|nr:hypothetical protein [Chitinophagaceae bacterium]